MTSKREPAALAGPMGYALRLVWTGLSFALFAVGAIIFGLVYLPVVNLMVRDPLRRQIISRNGIAAFFGAFIRFMAVFLMTYRITGLERDADYSRCVVVANHPTLIDAVFLMWLFRGADCVVKADHWRNPLTAVAVRAARYLPNDDDEYLLETAVQRVRNGACLVLFPEGTRTKPGGGPPFRRGAAVIAARAGADIIPVRLRCQPPSLRKGEPWYVIPERRASFNVDVLPRILTTDATAEGSEKTRTKKLTQTLKTLLFEE